MNKDLKKEYEDVWSEIRAINKRERRTTNRLMLEYYACEKRKLYARKFAIEKAMIENGYEIQVKFH